jgi:hypothetical protein
MNVNLLLFTYLQLSLAQRKTTDNRTIQRFTTRPITTASAIPSASVSDSDPAPTTSLISDITSPTMAYPTQLVSDVDTVNAQKQPPTVASMLCY